MVSIPDWLLLTIQWVHHLGAVSWVGGSIFYRFVLQPAFRTAGTETGSVRAIGQEFGRVVRIAIAILVITGAIMAVAHLGAGGNSPQYIGILALKIALAFYMFLVVWLRRRPSTGEGADAPVRPLSRLRRAITSTTALLILGIVVIGLADVLGAVGGHGSGGHSGAGTANGHPDAPNGSADHHESEEAGAGDVEDQKDSQDAPDAETIESDGRASDDHHGDDHHD